MSETLFQIELAKALTVIESPDEPCMTAPGSTLSRRFRHNSSIVTQLWAAKLDVPQARARRRAGDQEGSAAYGATGEAIVRGRRGTGPSWAA